MAAVYKISEEFFDDSFRLIAIHTNLEGYQLAYFINSISQLRLKRSFKDLKIKEVTYPYYEWLDEFTETEWLLITNKVLQDIAVDSLGLFGQGSAQATNFLVAERKDVDFFLKINLENETQVSEILECIKSIPRVRMAYNLEAETLKSKQNLIF